MLEFDALVGFVSQKGDFKGAWEGSQGQLCRGPYFTNITLSAEPQGATHILNYKMAQAESQWTEILHEL